MSDEKPELATKLQNLSQIDAVLASIQVERKKIEAQEKEFAAAIKKSEAERLSRHKIIEERRTRYARDEKSLKEEREKLTQRRKALTTLNNYKLQQAAEREIEHSAQQLDSHEDLLIKQLEDLEKLDQDLAQISAHLKSLTERASEFAAEALETLKTLEIREGEKLAAKTEIVKLVDSAAIQIYERVREKYPGSPVAKIEKERCGSCYMQVGPQTVVQILRGDKVVKCPGCGRIVVV
ncbi:MAG: hypothetical protein K1X83_07735 [Oligoflexia bacterium]|nr:hypothetical protein [Oligoflexia bacterium]